MALADGVCPVTTFRGFRVIIVPDDVAVDKWCPGCRRWLPATVEVFGQRSNRPQLRGECLECNKADCHARYRRQKAQ